MDLESEIVTSIAMNNGEIFGVSSSGHLVAFDKEAGSWVMRSRPDILTVDRANKLTRAKPMPEAQGKYRNQDRTKEIEAVVRKLKIKMFWWIAGVISFLFMMGYLFLDFSQK